MSPARVTRAAEALAENRVRIARGEEPGVYLVASFSRDGETYRVRPAERSCTCPDHLYRGTETCKHIAAVLLSGV